MPFVRDFYFSASIPNTFFRTEVKVLLSRKNRALFMYFLFHASVKNTLSSATDSLGNFEMCPCDHIEY